MAGGVLQLARLGDLRFLDLHDTQLGAEEALAAAQFWPRLEHLRLSVVARTRMPGLERLASDQALCAALRHLPGLTLLDLSGQSRATLDRCCAAAPLHGFKT
mmetsp:Transcript_3300/g.9569  ORF Transcript_3300/g.9569 Transcript_3300/m.9569 type:complete len:102 (+) Transcript_3300:891-1196(+)